jgi:hypothetical protein
MTANNESRESQVQGRRLTQGTDPVWKKGLQTLKSCTRPGGMPTDILNHHLSDTIHMGYSLNVLARLSPHEQRCLLL